MGRRERQEKVGENGGASTSEKVRNEARDGWRVGERRKALGRLNIKAGRRLGERG